MRRFASVSLVVLAVLILGVVSLPAQPVGMWSQLPNTRTLDAMDMADFYSGQSAYNPRDLFAYSGADLLQINGVWGFIITGGGHAATPDNSTIWVPFDGSGPRALHPPYVTPDRNYRYDTPYEVYLPVGVWTDARKSRHTYGSFKAILKNGQPHLFLHGGSLYTGAGGGTPVTRLFDLSQSFSQAAASPSLGWPRVADGPRGTNASSAGWDAVTRRVVVRGQSFVGAYSPDTNTWVDWNIQPVATLCCDFSATATVDVVGRKMYVLGDGLAEQYNLDDCPGTGCYTDLSTRPWAVNFARRGTLASSSWHAGTRQIITWGGGQNLTATDPVSGSVTTMAMGGVTVSAPDGSGTFGRFQVIPGTDQVVLVNSVFENVFIGTMGTGVTPPPTIPPASASLTSQPSTITQGQSALLTLFTPTLDYHNVFINGVRPSGVASGTTTTWTLNVVPSATTVYNTSMTTASGVPYPVLTTTVSVSVAAPTLTALPPTIMPGQSSAITLVLPTTNYHNVKINGVPWPGCVASGAGYTCTLTVMPTVTTTYPSSAISPSGSAVTMPSVTVTVGSPPPSGSVPVLPVGGSMLARTWYQRPVPPAGSAYMGGPGGKHGRVFYHAGLKGLVFAGGDWKTSQPTLEDGNGVGSEVWTLNAVTDTWTLLRQFCISGQPQPGRPDTVTWAYDQKRNQAYMAPGFYFITQGTGSNCGAVEGLGGYTFSFSTRRFTGPDALAGLSPPPAGWGGDNHASFGLVDPVADELLRVRNGPLLERFNLTNKTWRVNSLTLTAGWNPVPNRAQSVIDVSGRAVYFLDVWATRSLIKINLTDASVTAIPLPPQYITPYDSAQDVYLAFDPINRVVLVPNNRGMGESPLQGLGSYAVDTGTWTWEAVPETVWGSVWGFDETLGALIGIGKRQNPTSYYMYKVK